MGRIEMNLKRCATIVSCLILLLVSGVFAQPESHFFDSDGVKIHYVIQGTGEPVLLIHGFSANIQAQWGLPGIIAALAQDYEVIALDNRGHGQSDKPHDPEQYGQKMVEDSIHLLDHLKIKKAHVVGYSMGGFITMKLIATHPDRVISAVAGGAGWGRENDPKIQTIKLLADSLEQGNGFGPLFISLTPDGEPKPTEEQIKNMSALISRMNDVQALAACVRNFNGLIVTEKELRANKIPTLAIIGGKDPLKTTVDPLVGVMSNLEVVVIDDANHMTAFGKPVFTSTLKDFLAKHHQGSESRTKVPAAAGN